MTTVEQMKTLFEEFLKENVKHEKGNASAGTRARKALSEISKLARVRRNEITLEKNSRKQAKQVD